MTIVVHGRGALRPVLVGILGWSRVGKDTVARMLADEVERRMDAGGRLANALARELWWIEPPAVLGTSWPIKSVSHRLYGRYGMEDGEFYELPENEHLRDVVLPGLGMTPVQAWIHVSKGLRAVHPGVFVDEALELAKDYRLNVYKDVRTPYEFEAFPRVGPTYWVRVVGRPQAVVKELDRLVDDRPADWVVRNDGTLEDLRAKVQDLAGDLLEWALRRGVRP